MLCRRTIKGSLKFKLDVEVFKIINIILLYEEQFYQHIFILISGDITSGDFTFLSEVVCRSHTPTARGWITCCSQTATPCFCISASLQQNTLCKGASMGAKNLGRSLHQSHGGRAEGWFTAKWVLDMMGEIKNVILGPRTSDAGNSTGIWGWPHASQMAIIKPRLSGSLWLPFSAAGWNTS